MEHLGTLEPQTGQASTQAPEPKDEKQKQFDKERLKNSLADVQKIVSFYPVENRAEVLTVALEQATKSKGATEKIVEIGKEIRRTCSSLLDSKAKATIALLSELSRLSGITNVGVDFATDILHSAFGQKDVQLALEQFPDDSDVAFLSYVFGLAHSVVKAEDKIFLREIAAEEETIAEELEDAVPEESETQDQLEQEQRAEMSVSEETLERLKNFYKNLDPRTKLAILTLSEIQCLDGINFQISKKGEDKLYDQIWDDMQNVCLETFHRKPGDVPDTALGVIDSIAAIGKTNEDVWLCGVWEACRMVVQNT